MNVLTAWGGIAKNKPTKIKQHIAAVSQAQVQTVPVPTSANLRDKRYLLFAGLGERLAYCCYKKHAGVAVYPHIAYVPKICKHT